MTIFATHFALVLGAWRLRVRIDLDEPRDDDAGDASERKPAPYAPPASPPPQAAFGRN